MCYEKQKKSCSDYCDYLCCSDIDNICFFGIRRRFGSFLSIKRCKNQAESEKNVAFFIFFRKLLYKTLILCYNYCVSL